MSDESSPYVAKVGDVIQVSGETVPVLLRSAYWRVTRIEHGGIAIDGPFKDAAGKVRFKRQDYN